MGLYKETLEVCAHIFHIFLNKFEKSETLRRIYDNFYSIVLIKILNLINKYPEYVYVFFGTFSGAPGSPFSCGFRGNPPFFLAIGGYGKNNT